MKTKKSIITLLAVGLFIIATVFVGGLVIKDQGDKIKKLNSENLDMAHVATERDSTLNSLLATFDEIETNLTYIKQKRNQLEIKQSETGLSQRESILNDIRLLDSLIEANNLKVKDLTSKLHKSGVKLTSLNNKIESLNKNIELQNKEVAQLRETLQEREIEIDDLSGKLNVLTAETQMKDMVLSEKDGLIVQKDNELNKAYVAYGSFKELKDHGVVTKNGGILGIGSEKSIKNNIDTDSFIELDMRDTKEIPLFSKKASLITEHPDSSYQLLVDDGLVTYLQIEDPQEFWKLTKYAVIETK